MMARGSRARIAATIFLAVIIGTVTSPFIERLAAQEKFDNLQRGRVRIMLKNIEETIRKHYYDPKYHGVDIEAQFKTAEERVDKAPSLGQAYGAIFSLFDSFDDSHTFFEPPPRPVQIRYGFYETMVGDKCFITTLQPKTDAAAKLKLGDEILTMEGFRPTRDTLGKMDQYFRELVPRASLHLSLRAPDGTQRMAEIQPRIKQLSRVPELADAYFQKGVRMPKTYVEMGDDLMIWKMPNFEIGENDADAMFERARKHKALILDLRGNPGGFVKTLERALGDVLDHDVTIAKRIGRKSDLKPLEAKGRGTSAYTGKLIVLVDSQSASAAELFARVVQLEHRGSVLGDASSGSVMEALFYPFTLGADVAIFYGMSLTEADLIMSDGRSLEHNGVVPDEVVLPTASDLAAVRDPVMVRAAELAGVKLDPEKAGKYFPLEWPAD